MMSASDAARPSQASRGRLRTRRRSAGEVPSHSNASLRPVVVTALIAAASVFGGCAVVSVAGAAAGAAISVTGAVVATGVRVTGKVVEKTVDLVVP